MSKDLNVLRHEINGLKDTGRNENKENYCNNIISNEHHHMQTFGHSNIKLYKALNDKSKHSDKRNFQNMTVSSFRHKNYPKENAWVSGRDMFYPGQSDMDSEEIIQNHQL